MEDHKLDIRLEQAVLLGLELPKNRGELEESLDELASLADTAGVKTMERITQRRYRIDVRYYVGKGKAEEAGEAMRKTNSGLLIVDDDLSPAQLRNLEEIVQGRVIDRTELILAIFADRAKTHQARVQVELAQLEYTLPRLRKMWSHLTSNQEKGGVAARGGAGERQIELDRRMIGKRISDLKRELVEIKKRKTRTIRNRDELFTVALVGYTNAGKSTLMNSLTDAGVFVENKLFATLDTRTRVWKLTPGHRCLLSDTVGFIKRLPHKLVEAFHATLEETVTADLLLNVVDTSVDEPESQIEAVEKVLGEIKADKIPRILVFNKCDLIDPALAHDKLKSLQMLYPDSIAVSAVTRDGLENLGSKVTLEMRQGWIDADIDISTKNGKLVGILREYTEIVEENYDNKRAFFKVKLDPRIRRKLREAMLTGDIVNFQDQPEPVLDEVVNPFTKGSDPSEMYPK